MYVYVTRSFGGKMAFGVFTWTVCDVVMICGMTCHVRWAALSCL